MYYKIRFLYFIIHMSISEPIAQFAPDNADSLKQRQALARMIMNLFEHWQLAPNEQAALLGLSPNTRSTLARYRKPGEALPNTPDLLDRVGHLLGIHTSLRLIFPQNRDLVYRWIKTPNRRLEGQVPLDIMLDRGFLGIVAIRRYLDFERGQ